MPKHEWYEASLSCHSLSRYLLLFQAWMSTFLNDKLCTKNGKIYKAWTDWCWIIAMSKNSMFTNASCLSRSISASDFYCSLLPALQFVHFHVSYFDKNALGAQVKLSLHNLRFTDGGMIEHLQRPFCHSCPKALITVPSFSTMSAPIKT